MDRVMGHRPLGRPGRVAETRELVVIGTPYVVAYAVLDNQLMLLSCTAPENGRSAFERRAETGPLPNRCHSGGGRGP